MSYSFEIYLSLNLFVIDIFDTTHEDVGAFFFNKKTLFM